MLINIPLDKKTILDYIELYNTESYLFKTVSPNVKRRGYLKFGEFFDICMWKSVRPKKRYLNNKNIVESISKRALDEIDEVKKIEILCELDGVSIPTASAILCIIYPDIYPVIDLRCVEMLNDFGFDMPKGLSTKCWLKYLNIMKQLSSKYNITPRQLDMAFFAMHREKLNKGEYKNLY